VEERRYLGGYEVYRKTIASALEDERETLHIADDRSRVCMVETLTWEEGDEVEEPEPRYRFQLDNHLGTVSVEVDSAGAVISYEEYHPNGTSAYRAFTGEVSAKRYRYIGCERDEETGLYLMGARYYAAWLGRWTAADPAGTVDGTNLFAYVRGSPIGLQDPSGTEGFSAVDYDPEGNDVEVISGPPLPEGYVAPEPSGSDQPAVTFNEVPEEPGPWADEYVYPVPTDEEYGEPIPIEKPVPPLVPEEGVGTNEQEVGLPGTPEFDPNATDVAGRPLWTQSESGEWQRNVYIDIGIGTSDVEIVLALGGLGRIIGTLGRAFERATTVVLEGPTIALGRDVEAMGGAGAPLPTLRYHYTYVAESEFAGGFRAGASVTDIPYYTTYEASQKLGIPLPDKVIPIIDRPGNFVYGHDVKPSRRFFGGGQQWFARRHLPPEDILPARPVTKPKAGK
jgi:RHS repeat-associated protein